MSIYETRTKAPNNLDPQALIYTLHDDFMFISHLDTAQV